MALLPTIGRRRQPSTHAARPNASRDVRRRLPHRVSDTWQAQSLMTDLPTDPAPESAPESAAWRTDPEDDRTDRAAGAAFLDGWDQEPEDDPGLPSARAMILTSASVTMVAVLGCIAFVSGALWASLHEPDLDYTNVAAEIAVKVAYALFVGALTAAVVVALATAVGGFFVLRHRRRTLGERTPEPRPVAERPAPPPRTRRERTH